MNKYINLISFFLSFLISLSYAQNGDNYIKLKNGEIISGKIEYKKPFLGSPYILLDDSIEYKIENILLFQSNDGYFRKVDKNRNEFAQRVMEGKIDLYRETSMYFTPGNVVSTQTPGGTQTMYTPGYTSSVDYDYFSKDGGEILEASYSNLLSALSDNNESIKHLKTYNTLNVVQWILVGSGIGLLIAGLATSSKEELNTGLMITGGVVALLAWIPHLIGKSEYRKAIEVYNQ